jgi:phosphoglycerate dehydrogenase-like enzyme
VIEACPNRKLICAAFTGIDHVDQEAGKARGIILHNAAGYAVHAASESANGLMVVVLRRIVSANTTILTGSDNRELTGHELFRKTLGAVGCGAIGLQAALLGNAFGCRVFGFESQQLRIDVS